jgi:hypothetical protein
LLLQLDNAPMTEVICSHAPIQLVVVDVEVPMSDQDAGLCAATKTARILSSARILSFRIAHQPASAEQTCFLRIVPDRHSR